MAVYFYGVRLLLLHSAALLAYYYSYQLPIYYTQCKQTHVFFIQVDLRQEENVHPGYRSSSKRLFPSPNTGARTYTHKHTHYTIYKCKTAHINIYIYRCIILERNGRININNGSPPPPGPLYGRLTVRRHYCHVN